MKTIIPHGNNVLCKLISSKTRETSSGFIYESNDIDIYEIISVSSEMSKGSLDIKKGDKIIVNSTGTLLENDNHKFYLFNIDSIKGKVLE